MNKFLRVVGLALALAWAMPAPAETQPSCGLACVEWPDSSVYGAAGFPKDLLQAVSRLKFSGDSLARDSQADVTVIATLWKQQPRSVLNLAVRGDAGLPASKFDAQAGRRAQVLAQALVAAGLPASQLQVKAIATK